jgi:hypothetical protein
MPRARPPVFSIAHSLSLRLLAIGLLGAVLALISALST